MLEPWQARVELEYRELSEKTKALEVFLPTIGFTNLEPEEQDLLTTQLSAMRLYKATLEKRLDRMGYYYD